MSYRDDVDALFHRATSLQAEVDRLRTELASSRPPAPRKPGAWRQRLASPPEPEPRSTPASRLQRIAWLPPSDGTAITDDVAHELAELRAGEAVEPPEELGMLVARLTEVEHALVTRVLELLIDDDFRAASVRRRTEAFDQLAIELRARLAGPS